ncbi:hypothetical protein QYS49_29495 [Marivirga salinae]|uniref:Uncharacterized protein n=1 Tax=Marivirga salinarum TaxID=3059078 RepID=A0AA49GAZ4_9BACT|nr:hypothetical protein [Marivirga sp. BDSF4-3]WKK75585.2 hypothetical protein QYS49_29495 [Marivirga sp. BDSF4-3]
MEKKAKIKYNKTNTYQANVSTGAFGGISSTGNICMNFYLERVPLPDNIELTLDESGKPLKEDIENGNFISVRDVQSGVIMDINTAKSFHDWLGKKIDELEKLLNNDTSSK